MLNYLSIDHLKMGLIRSVNTVPTPEDNDVLTEYLLPIAREMIKTAVENKQDFIVEGCYIPFDQREDFDEQYLAHIRFICLAMTEEFIENHDALALYETLREAVLEKAPEKVPGTRIEVKTTHKGESLQNYT